MDSHLPPSDRVLRQITLLVFLPAFALLIPYGVGYHSIVPTLGLVPAFLTSLLATTILLRDIRPSLLTTALDLFLALFHIGILIPGWVQVADRWRNNGVQLASYASMPLMVDFAIHAWFVLRVLPYLFTSRRGRQCPHCHHEINTSRLPVFRHTPQSSHGRVGGDKEEAYIPPAEYEDARASMGGYATSGFPTPRVSAETLDSNAESLSLV